MSTPPEQPSLWNRHLSGGWCGCAIVIVGVVAIFMYSLALNHAGGGPVTSGEATSPDASPAPATPSAPVTLDDSNWPDIGTMKGHGNKVTTRFSCPLPWRVKWNYSGGSNFVVRYCSPDGEEVSLLVNEIGPKSGEAYADVRADNGYLKVEADGAWSLVIERRD